MTATRSYTITEEQHNKLLELKAAYVAALKENGMDLVGTKVTQYPISILDTRKSAVWKTYNDYQNCLVETFHPKIEGVVS